MPGDEESRIKIPVMQDQRELTENDLVADAAKVVHQLEQFYRPGEVEATVLLSFRGIKGNVAVGTSVEDADRLRWQVGVMQKAIPRMNLRIKHRKLIT